MTYDTKRFIVSCCYGIGSILFLIGTFVLFSAIAKGVQDSKKEVYVDSIIMQCEEQGGEYRSYYDTKTESYIQECKAGKHEIILK